MKRPVYRLKVIESWQYDVVYVHFSNEEITPRLDMQLAQDHTLESFCSHPQIAFPDLASWAGWHPVSPHPSQSVNPPTLRHIWVSQQMQLPKPRVKALATEHHSAPQGAAHVLHPALSDPL